MDNLSTSLSSRAFGRIAEPGLVIATQSHQDALRSLSAALGHARGIALLMGPKGSGKTTLLREQLDWSAREVPTAMLDGEQLTPQQLTCGMLQHFKLASPGIDEDEDLRRLSRFLAEQAAQERVPVLILDNADRTPPSTFRLLNWLAALDARGTHALRIVFGGDSRLGEMLRTDALRNIARRGPVSYSLNPLSLREAIVYLRTRFIAAGGRDSESVFAVEVCEKLWASSCGWPGELNRLAAMALERRKDLQDAQRSPRIIVSRDGEALAEYALTEKRYIIGRTGLADIVIEDSYTSKMHAMLQVYANAVVLLDLNSTNGTTVNSVVTERTILRENDIISLGHYRLKIVDVPPVSKELDERITSADTLRMQHLGDIRRNRARRTIRALKNL